MILPITEHSAWTTLLWVFMWLSKYRKINVSTNEQSCRKRLIALRSPMLPPFGETIIFFIESAPITSGVGSSTRSNNSLHITQSYQIWQENRRELRRCDDLHQSFFIPSCLFWSWLGDNGMGAIQKLRQHLGVFVHCVFPVIVARWVMYRFREKRGIYTFRWKLLENWSREFHFIITLLLVSFELNIPDESSKPLPEAGMHGEKRFSVRKVAPPLLLRSSRHLFNKQHHLQSRLLLFQPLAKLLLLWLISHLH